MRFFKDIVGGVGLAAIGGYVAYTASTTLSIGTSARMGPGYFPLSLGVILIVLGIYIAVSDAIRQDLLPRWDLRALLAVVSSVVSFAVVFRLFGLLPAIVVVVVLSSFADGSFSGRRIVILSFSLSIMSIVIFKYLVESNLKIISFMGN